MPHSFFFVALIVGCLAAPSLCIAGGSRGSRGALAGALAAVALTGPTGIAVGAAVGSNASVAMTDAITRGSAGGALGIDPMPTCGTPPTAARRDAGATKRPC